MSLQVHNYDVVTHKVGKTSAMVNMYSRQIIFPGIGEEGQHKLSHSYAVIIGCGALGTIIATSLALTANGIKAGLYYMHERVWDRSDFGRKKVKEDYTI
jgi:hypothetical protein